LAEFSPLAVDTFERKVLVFFAGATVVVGLVSSGFLAARLDNRTTIPTAYWEKVLTIAGVASLPIVAMVVLVVRAAMESSSPLGSWGAGIVIGGAVAFATAMLVILICLFQIVVASDAATGMTPSAPAEWVTWVATLGVGVTLSGAAVGVAATALNTIDVGSE
jgi:hypothetical protein